MTRWRVVLALSLATLCAPAFGAIPGRPGTINYIEGSSSIAGQELKESSVGSASLEAGQVLSTGQGKVEVLLTPGVFLRLDSQSAVRMIDAGLTHTVVEMERGHAMIEVDQLLKDNHIQMLLGGVPVQIVKTGLYEFSAHDDTVAVYDGKAAVHLDDNRWVLVKKHHMLALNSDDPGKPRKFDARITEDNDLYQWSSLRSQYLSEANEQMAGEYAGAAGFAPGWYWDPYFWDYTFLGAGPLWSPFGFGFYPFGGMYGMYGGYGGFYGGGYGGGYGGFRGDGFHPGGYHGGIGGGGFHGGGMGGGGFHGGGGGGVAVIANQTQLHKTGQ